MHKLYILSLDQYNIFSGVSGKFQDVDGQTGEDIFKNIQASVLDRIDDIFRGRLSKLTEVIVNEEVTYINNLEEKLLPNDYSRIQKAVFYEMESITYFDAYSLGQDGSQSQGSGVNYTPSGRTIATLRDELTHKAMSELKKTDLWKDLRNTIRSVEGNELPGTWRIDAQFQDAVKLSALKYGVVVTYVTGEDGEQTSVTTLLEYKGEAETLMGSINENWDKIEELALTANPELVQKQLDEFRAELDALNAQDAERKLLNKRDMNIGTLINPSTPHLITLEDEEHTVIKAVGSKIFLYPNFLEDQLQVTMECIDDTAGTMEKWIKLTYYINDVAKEIEFQLDETDYTPDDLLAPQGSGEYRKVETLPRLSLITAIVSNGDSSEYEFSTNDFYEIEMRVASGETNLKAVDDRQNLISIVRVVQAVDNYFAGYEYQASSNQDNTAFITASLPSNFTVGQGIISVRIPDDIGGNGTLKFNSNVNLQTYFDVREGSAEKDPTKGYELVHTAEVKGKVLRLKFDQATATYICIDYETPQEVVHILRISDPLSNMAIGRKYKQQANQFIFMSGAINKRQPDLGNAYNFISRIIDGECIDLLTDPDDNDRPYWLVGGTFEVFSNVSGIDEELTGNIRIYTDNAQIKGYFMGEQASIGGFETIMESVSALGGFSELNKIWTGDNCFDLQRVSGTVIGIITYVSTTSMRYFGSGSSTISTSTVGTIVKYKRIITTTILKEKMEELAKTDKFIKAKNEWEKDGISLKKLLNI